jgi:hypothetical protein
VAVEASVAEVFFLGWLSTVSVYDTNTLVWKRDFTLPADVTGQPNQTLLRWGTAGLVAANDDTVVIIDDVFP